jgi:hypothetical protein
MMGGPDQLSRISLRRASIELFKCLMRIDAEPLSGVGLAKERIVASPIIVINSH